MSGHYNGFTHIVTIEILAKDLVSEPTFLKTNVFKIIQAEELSSGLWNNNNKHWVVPNSVYFTRRFNHNGANRQGISKKDTVLTKVVMFEASEYSSIIPLLDVQTYICCLQCIKELQKFLEDNHYNATAKQFVSGYHWCSFGTKTRKMDCSAFIRVALTSDYKRLMIIELCLQHENHDGSEDFYELLPKNRQLLSKDKNNVEELIKMKSSASAIRMKVLKETGVQMTAKDFQNLKQKIKPPNDNDTLKSVVALLRQTYHASVDVHTILTQKKDGNEKVFSSLLFQTESMKKTFQAWPEMIFVDGTYGLFKNQLITIVICIMDSNNISHIVAIGWVVNEEANTLLELMKSFKNRNIEGCSKVKTIMTDKDLTERAVLKELFVNADLYICEFHVLKIFSRTITKGAMNITSEERNTALNFLDRLTKCDTKEKYYELYTEFCNSVPESVLNYYNDNWHEIKEQWVRFWVSKNNFGNYTNNAVESINAQLKKEIKKNSTMKEFVDAFFSYLKMKDLAVKLRLCDDIYKRPLRGYKQGTTEHFYTELLTPTAAKLVLGELAKRSPLTFDRIDEQRQLLFIKYSYTILRISVDECECSHWTSYHLPCRHMFALRNHFELPLFDETLCLDRYKKDYNLKNQPILQNSIRDLRNSLPAISSYSEVASPAITIKTHRQRLKCLKTYADRIAYLGSLSTKHIFEQKLNCLSKLESAWKSGQDVEINILDPSEKFNRLSLDNDCSKSSEILMPAPIKISGRPNTVKSTISFKKR